MTRDDDFIGQVEAYLDEYEGMTPLPAAVRNAVRAHLPETRQLGRFGGPMRRFNFMSNNFVRAGIAAAVIVLAVVVGINFLPGPNTGGPPEATSSPSPAPLAVGSFESHGGQIELEATGDGSNVTGSMTYADVGGTALGGFVVDLACTRTTDGGLILIGGPITESTNGYVESAPVGSNVAMILQRGSPVKAEVFVEHPDPHEANCAAFLASLSDERPAGALEPIEGSVELRP